MKKAEEKLIRLLVNAKGNSTDIYYTVYEEYLKSCKEPWHNLQTIIEYAGDVGEDDNNSKRVKAEIKQESIRNYGSFLREMVRLFIRENLTEEEFYKKLYNAVFVSELFPQNSDVQVILLQLLAKGIPDLPYFPLHDVLKMSDDDFRSETKKILPQIRKAMSILCRGLETNTEAISQLWPVSKELETDKEKIIFFSAVVGLAFNNRPK